MKAYAELAVSEGYPEGAVRVHREVWLGPLLDSPRLAELRSLSAAGGLEALYVCWNDLVSKDHDSLLRLLREFAGFGVTVRLVDDPAGTGDQD